MTYYLDVVNSFVYHYQDDRRITMPVGSTYDPLADFLRNKEGDVWDATFGDIERTLGRPLPASAYRYPAWWANQSGPGHSQTQGWRSVGWRTAKLNLERRRVRFERERHGSEADVVRSDREGLIKQARLLSGIEDREKLIDEALRLLIEAMAVDHLIAMGGAMPNLTIPPRERPDW